MIRLGSKLTPPGAEPAGPDRGIGRSHAIHVEDLDAFARLHREKGYRAAYCPAGLRSTMPNACATSAARSRRRTC